MASSAPGSQSPNRAQPMLDGPILPTLLAMTVPNLIALGSAAMITIAETAYVGRLGVHALGGVALVFPVIMLMQMLSAGAMGGAISGAISRALGAGDNAHAAALARAAAVIGTLVGLGFALLVWVAGPALFHLLGGRGETLVMAVTYAHVAALGLVAIWLSNCLASVLRGSGDMKTPALIQLAAGGVQIIVGGLFGLGLFGFPAWGVGGVALGQLVAFWLATAAFLLRLASGSSRVSLSWRGGWPAGAAFAGILRVGLVAALSPLQSVASVLILTAMVARFGPEALAGFGIGTRLEFLLIPIAFSVGVACLPMVGTAIGAGNVARARRVAWTAGALAAGGLALVGLIAGLAPHLWVDLFADEPALVAATTQYLRIASIGYPFFGLGLCLYFASQGAGRVGGPIVAQTSRLAIIVIGGIALTGQNADLSAYFSLSAVAMVAMGLGTWLAVRLTSWHR